MAEFPSAQWFNEVRKVYNADDAYRGAGGGQCNCRSAMKVGGRIFLLVFEGFEVSEAREVDGAELDSVDFYLEMSGADWKEMVQDIAENGSAGLDYTLNTLDLNRPDGLAQSVHGDQYREDLFFRYNQTFQFFFDASARVKTTFS
ncbi:MAG: hypothetical protein OES38_19215 [Gammaproteobacteria bacterium]|nr:hypothetical protein [Gammaproteobacteria bacterium]